jgi:hypothetical protein
MTFVGRISLRIGVACGMPLILLAACVELEAGMDLLPSASGWRSLPLRSWVMNDGLGPAAITYCPQPRCADPSVVATLVAQGDEARRLERALASPRTLLMAKRFEVARARDPRLKHLPKTPREERSSERAERLEIDGLRGYRVALTPKSGDGHAAYAVVLAKHEDGRFKVAFAVSTSPDAALEQSRAAAKSF